MFKNGIDIDSYCEFVASEHCKNLLPSPGLRKLPSKTARQSNSSKANLNLVAIVKQGYQTSKKEFKGIMI